MDWFSLLYNILCIAAQGILQLGFTCRFTGKRPKTWLFFLYLFLLYGIDGLARIFSSDTSAILMQISALFLINRLPDDRPDICSISGTYRSVQNNLSVSCIAAILAVYITQLSFGILNSVEFFVFPHFVGRKLLYLILILGTLFSFVLSFFCYHLILNCFSFEDGCHEPYIGILLPPVLFFFAAEFYILHTAYSQPSAITAIIRLPERWLYISLLVLQALGLAALFSALYSYRRIRHSLQLRISVASLMQEAHAQKTYVAEAQIRYGQTQAFRHDIKNHLSVIEGLLKKEEIQQAKSYLQKLTAATDELSFPYRTGNPVVDILLMEKLAIAKNDKIETDISLTLPKEGAPDELDWCILFGNALDNAICACKAMQEIYAEEEQKCKRWIRISGEQQGDFYMLEFENTCIPGDMPTAGTGLSNIRSVAEKYNGTMVIEKTGSLFHLNIILDTRRIPTGIK